MSDWETIIGLEVHAQLSTESKIFCGCSTLFGSEPNANTCPVCLGLPGSLPILNRRAVELGARAALALGLQINQRSIFARKNYFYPDPRSYRFDGELNIANRGLMEFVEMLKVDEKFLYSLLTLSQEQNIKTGRFALIYADEAIISHTNENEYQSFVANRKSEALQDRIIMIRVPYNLKVSQEERIYDKLLKQSDALRNIHIAPNALKIAAMFAVMTRLEEPK